MRHTIVQLQTHVGKAKGSVPEVAGTLPHGMEVVIAMITVLGPGRFKQVYDREQQ
jgi:hypothetical protein